MGCAASTQDDTIAMQRSTRGSRPAATTPDLLRRNTSNVATSVQRSLQFSSLANGSGDSGRTTPFRRADDDSVVLETGAEGSPSPPRSGLDAKKHVSPHTNGKTVCSLALVDALPRFYIPPAHIRSDCSSVTGASTTHQPSKNAAPASPTMVGMAVAPQAQPPSPHHSQRDCSICLMSLGGSMAVVMACLHTFHYDCAKEWLSQHEGSCPDCRTKVCVESFWFPQEIAGDAELAKRMDEEATETAAAAASQEGEASHVDDAGVANAAAASIQPPPASDALISNSISDDDDDDRQRGARSEVERNSNDAHAADLSSSSFMHRLRDDVAPQLVAAA